MRKVWGLMIVGLAAFALIAAAQQDRVGMDKDEERFEIATFAAGCFWCVEAVFESVEGVHSVTAGYIGGHDAKPTYKQVCSGRTGHAEAVQVAFDPNVVSYATLLELFWRMHDPTTPNRQGADVGTQYRSAIFYHSDQQEQVASASRKALNDSGTIEGKVVTEIVPAGAFYEAEKEHQDYFRKNPSAAYCRVVIRPKLKKLGIQD